MFNSQQRTMPNKRNKRYVFDSQLNFNLVRHYEDTYTSDLYALVGKAKFINTKIIIIK